MGAWKGMQVEKGRCVIKTCESRIRGTSSGNANISVKYIYIYVSEIDQERWKKFKKKKIFEHTLRSGWNERVINEKRNGEKKKKNVNFKLLIWMISQ